MPSFYAELPLVGRAFLVLCCTFTIHQHNNSRDRPTSKAYQDSLE